jgi:hypothetical protein
MLQRSSLNPHAAGSSGFFTKLHVGSMVRAADEKLKEETVVGDLQVTFRPLVAFFENGKFHMIVY